ncbi:hypothetical protein DFH07DRAFT_968195 [Mycena maculata]|uniref:Uncharacterized protein n=1 Tax=Mycena maculata TaxID=230809 RepID=A0AAD7I1G1_9AGAR|nr:hypothetical protein DFH07DRAFT_968195 [Mycena maculata]
MALPKDPASWKGAMKHIQFNLYILAGEVLLYGAYAAMFGFYLHILRGRGISNNRFLTVATICLFVLCTAHLALLAATTVFLNQFHETSVGEESTSSLEISASLNRAATTVYVTSNVIADCVFIFRCYAIWNFSIRVIILPTVLTALVGGGSSYIQEGIVVFSLQVLGYANIAVSLQNGLTMVVAADPHSAIARLFFISVSISVFTTVILMGLSG